MIPYRSFFFTASGDLIWELTLVENLFNARIVVPVQPRQLTGALTPTTEPVPGCPLVFGNVVGTPDSQQICQSNFVVTTFAQDCSTCKDLSVRPGLPSLFTVKDAHIERLLPLVITDFSLNSKVPYSSQRLINSKVECCSTWEKQTKNYVFYSTNIASVVRGPGSTLAEKGAYLNRPERQVTTAGLATYGMLRLFLSFLLFGSFDLSWLLRSNYERFLTALGSSEFCGFLPVFRESVYWTYFKK